MNADGWIELRTLTRHLRHEKQSIEGIFEDVCLAVGLRDRPLLQRIKPDVF